MTKKETPADERTRFEELRNRGTMAPSLQGDSKGTLQAPSNTTIDGLERGALGNCESTACGKRGWMAGERRKSSNFD